PDAVAGANDIAASRRAAASRPPRCMPRRPPPINKPRPAVPLRRRPIPPPSAINRVTRNGNDPSPPTDAANSIRVRPGFFHRFESLISRCASPKLHDKHGERNPSLPTPFTERPATGLISSNPVHGVFRATSRPAVDRGFPDSDDLHSPVYGGSRFSA